MSRETLMRVHDAKTPGMRALAWGEGYWAYERPTQRIGHRRTRTHTLPMLRVERDEDGCYRVT